jgi:hypothetical protein
MMAKVKFLKHMRQIVSWIWDITEEENDSTEHPLELVVKHFEKYTNSEEFLEEKKLCVLLSTGSLNPIHLGHVQAFTSAKEFLEKKYDFKVLAGFISPSDKNWCSRNQSFAKSRCNLTPRQTI